jgi:hypothetical protein
MTRSTSMGIWILFIWVCVAGAAGGVLNVLLAGHGFTLPSIEKVGGVRVFHAGTIGSIIIGAFAAGLSWALYGPLSQVAAIAQPAPPTATQTAPAATLYNLSLGTLAGAMLVGAGGAKWLTSQIDNHILKAAAIQAAKAPASPEGAVEMASASATQVLEIAKRLDHG